MLYCMCILLQTFDIVFLSLAFGHSYQSRGVAVEKSINYGVSFSPMEYIVLDPSRDCNDLFQVSPQNSFAVNDGPGTVLCRDTFGNDGSTSNNAVCALFVCFYLFA